MSPPPLIEIPLPGVFASGSPHGPISDFSIVTLVELLIVTQLPLVDVIRIREITVPFSPSMAIGPDEVSVSELAEAAKRSTTATAPAIRLRLKASGNLRRFTIRKLLFFPARHKSAAVGDASHGERRGFSQSVAIGQRRRSVKKNERFWLEFE